MERLYNDEYYIKINKMRTKYLVIYILSLLVAITIETILLVYYSTRPFGTPLETPLLVIILVFGGLFTAFSVIYLTIPFGRVSKYRDILVDLLDNEKTYSDVTVINFDTTLTVKYGVDFYRLNVLEWSETEEDYIERSVLVDNEIKNLNVLVGDILKIETTSNVLTAFEIVSRKP